MKFQRLEGFEKHFKEAFPLHLSPIYGVVCSGESELKKIFSSLRKRLEKECDLKKCTFLKDALIHINSASLFSGKVAAAFDGIDFLSKEELELLTQYIKAPNPRGHLLLGGIDSKVFTELYKVGKKEMVFLDLSKEKPWEEKERLQKWVLQTLSYNKKKIAADALQYLLETLPQDRLFLQQELDKLVCYIGDRTEISRKDVETLCLSSEDQNLFQLARDLVWKENFVPPILGDLAFLLPLIGQLRNQLEMGLKMTALLKKRKASEEIASTFPKLWPKALEQVMQGASKRREGYFRKGLLALYALEVGLKTSQGKPENLFTKYILDAR